jgi:hypothetical protein
MIPSPGRIVHYRLTAQDAQEVNRRRADARASVISSSKSGAQIHVGNGVTEGDVYPLIITRVWSQEPTEQTSVNGQVLLDGNDCLWATSRQQGTEPGQWSEPRRI